MVEGNERLPAELPKQIVKMFIHIGRSLYDQLGLSAIYHDGFQLIKVNSTRKIWSSNFSYLHVDLVHNSSINQSFRLVIIDNFYVIQAGFC